LLGRRIEVRLDVVVKFRNIVACLVCGGVSKKIHHFISEADDATVKTLPLIPFMHCCCLAQCCV
jgi:hypothetical protein